MLTDYESGGDLFFHLRIRGQFFDADARLYACEVLIVLEYLHQNNIMHRDLKPENILIDHEGHIKVKDYEYAKKMLHRYSGNTYTVFNSLIQAKTVMPMIHMR